MSNLIEIPEYLNASDQVFTKLRTNLMYIPNLQVITITSILPNEGKTTVSSHLALSFALAGKKVCLIDADARKAGLAVVFRVSRRNEGLTEFLSNQVEQCIYKTSNPNLDVILSGFNSPNPSELLQSEQFGSLLDALRKEYDTIIIDTPPITVAADACIVGNVSDGAVLVVRSGAVKKSELIRAKNELNLAKVNIVGTVLNGVKKGQSSYYSSYYNYYYYYGNYGKNNEKK